MNAFHSNIISIYRKQGESWLDELPELVTAIVVQQVRELLKCLEITAKTLKSLEGQISTDEAFAMLHKSM